MSQPEQFLHNCLVTDLYEMTMAAGYHKHARDTRAVFELSCHTLPPSRSFLIACGLEQIVDYVLGLKFDDEDIAYLKTSPVFQSVDPSFFTYLKGFRFTGDLWAMPEGEIFFAHEPVIQVAAPIIEAQVLETYLLAVMNIETLVATKAARVVQAACHDGQQRAVVDFGSRRAHGPEAAVLAARSAFIGGCLGTSNVFAGKRFGLPVFGTMAHSWVQAFDSETEAFSRYMEVFPADAILLIDTYDTLQAAKLIGRQENKLRIRAVRLDSGNLNLLSKKVRQILDAQGLAHVKIVASGNLNEYKILDLVKNKAPIDFFGVGTEMVTSRDYPALDLTYKLVQISDLSGKIKYKAKRSQGKITVPGRKQVFRKFGLDGRIEEDMIGLFDEKIPKGTGPLLKPVIQAGHLKEPLPNIQVIQSGTAARIRQLPPALLRIKQGKNYLPKYSRKITSLAKRFWE